MRRVIGQVANVCTLTAKSVYSVFAHHVKVIENLLTVYMEGFSTTCLIGKILIYIATTIAIGMEKILANI